MLLLGRVGSLHLWVGLGRVKKMVPTFNCDVKNIITSLERCMVSVVCVTLFVCHQTSTKHLHSVVAKL